MCSLDALPEILRRSTLPYVFSAIILVPFFIIGCQPGTDSTAKKPVFPDSTTHYQIDAQIRPDSGQFDVAIDMQFVPKASTDTLRFLLHDAFKLDELSGPVVGNYSISPWHFGGEDTVHTKVVSIPLSKTMTPSDQVAITWEYAGRLQNRQIPGIGGAVVSPHWTELPLEAMWVPVHASIGTRFTFDATVDLPKSYEVASIGVLQKTDAGWHIQSPVPGPDVPLVISDQMQTQKYTNGEIPLTVYHGGAPDSLTSFVAQRTRQILDRYTRRFQGGSDTDALRITLAPVERTTPSSYARTGLIALRHDIEPDTSLFGLIAHEAAHLWWTDSVNPMSRHNFLNESFAEYESWLALRKIYDDTIFQKRIEEARKNAQKAPSFDEWQPRFDGALSYNKGPLLLHQLHQRIGEANYQSFLRSLQQKDVGTIGDMIATLEEVTNPDTATWFRKKL